MQNLTAALGARAAARSLHLRGPVTLESVQTRLEAIRGRPIVVREMPRAAATGICGLWIAVEDRDLVFHAPARSALHRQQIILHEFAHIILRERGDVPTDPVPSALFEDLDPGTVVSNLAARSTYDNVEELAAEMLADRLARAIRTTRPFSDGSICSEVLG